METWKDIPGYEGRYKASNLGKVKSIPKKVSCHKSHLRKQPGKTLKPSLKNNGYLGITLFYDGLRKYISVHRVIATTFLPNPKNFPHVNHKNGNKEDNRVENLEWCSISYNMKHSFRVLGRKKPQSMKGVFGKNNPLSKKVVQKTINGDIVKIWDSFHDADREGFQLGNVFACCVGKRKTHKGFRWSYQ